MGCLRHLPEYIYIYMYMHMHKTSLFLRKLLCKIDPTERMFARREQCQATVTTAAAKTESALSGLDLDTHPITNTKASKYKRRFSDEQIKSLEFMFESESRPESRLKQQLANDLGLQPRQVAIWFQNRRARSKTKQIEREYSLLKESYENLASGLESLKRENQLLRIQLHTLRHQYIWKDQGDQKYAQNQTGDCYDSKSENEHPIFKSDEKPSLLLEGNSQVISSGHDSRNVENIEEEKVILKMIEATEGSLSLSGNWYSSESTFLDESSCSSKWWEIW